jgi:hypothetical protein
VFSIVGVEGRLKDEGVRTVIINLNFLTYNRGVSSLNEYKTPCIELEKLNFYIEATVATYEKVYLNLEGGLL